MAHMSNPAQRGKTYVTFSALMHYACQLGQARKSGDRERIEKAQREHDEYVDLCRRSDGMIVAARGSTE